MSPKKERDPPPDLRVGRYYTRADLANAAFAALADEGVTHQQAADELGAPHRTAVTRALNPDDPAGAELCAAIIERYGKRVRFDTDTPYYRAEKA